MASGLWMMTTVQQEPQNRDLHITGPVYSSGYLKYLLKFETQGNVAVLGSGERLHTQE